MKYPKLPDGPSSVGSAAIRALQNTGNDFQTRRGVGYVARLKDGFSRVETVGGPIYTVAGDIYANPVVPHQTGDYRQQWRVSKLAYGEISLDFGYAAGKIYNGTTALSNVTPFYPVPNPNPARPPGGAQVLQRREYSRWLIRIANKAEIGGFYPGFNFYTLVPDRASTSYSPGNRSRVPDIGYLGRLKVSGEPDIGVISAYLTPRTRTDVVGKVMLDLAVIRVYRDAAPVITYPEMPIAAREYMPPRIITSSSAVYMIVFEWANASWYGPRDLTRDYRPPVWLMKSVDHGESWTFKNIHSELVGGCDLIRQNLGFWVEPSPDTQPYNTEAGFYSRIDQPLAADGKATFTDSARFSYSFIAIEYTPSTPPRRDYYPFEAYPFYPGDPDSPQFSAYNSMATYSASLMAIVMTEDDGLVLMFPYLYGYFALAWRFRVVRITGSGTTATVMFDSGNSSFRYHQSAVYGGKGSIIAKRLDNYDGRNPITTANVSFDYSNDYGATWTNVVPAGLPSPLKSPNYGDLYVETPATDTKPARILLPCYDITKGAYFAYITTDNGASWKKGSRIAESAFKRMDVMNVAGGENGGNFKTIVNVGTAAPVAPVDRVLPKRFKRTAA